MSHRVWCQWRGTRCYTPFSFRLSLVQLFLYLWFKLSFAQTSLVLGHTELEIGKYQPDVDAKPAAEVFSSSNAQGGHRGFCFAWVYCYVRLLKYGMHVHNAVLPTIWRQFQDVHPSIYSEVENRYVVELTV